LEKLADLERIHNPEAAGAMEKRSKRRLELREQKPAEKTKINKKSQR
jgi:hypothetical protein